LRLLWVSDGSATGISSEYLSASFTQGGWHYVDGTSGPAPAGTVGFVFGCAKTADGTYKTYWRDQVRIYRANADTAKPGNTLPSYSGQGSTGTYNTYI